MIVVSHDRYFLDNVTNRTLELFDGTVDSYAGNFSAYWRQKAERLLVERRTYEKQQIEIEKTKDFIRRNHYGQKHAQAEDRRKKLERIELVPPPREIASPPMGFPSATRGGDIVRPRRGPGEGLRSPAVPRRQRRYPPRRALGAAGPERLRQDDAAAVPAGPGRARRGTDQRRPRHRARLFRSAIGRTGRRQPWWSMPSGRRSNQLNEQQRRDLLARFGLTGDTALQTVGSLSGGERCRAALARLAGAEANFLVLDEPTNHLDLWARDALEKAIAQFDGTVLFVSHDRYFVNRVADHLLVIESGADSRDRGQLRHLPAASCRPRARRRIA